MNHRPVPRVGRLLCGLASVFALGLLAAPASAQTSTVMFTVGPYVSVTFDEPLGSYDFFVLPSHYVGGVATRIIALPFTAIANTGFTATGTLTLPFRPGPIPAPGAWWIKLDGLPADPFTLHPGIATRSLAAGTHPGLAATLKVVLSLADGGGGYTYTGGMLTLSFTTP